MLNLIRNVIFIFLIICPFYASCNTDPKMYIDPQEMQMADGKMYLHTGENIWLEIESIASNQHGIYATQFEMPVKGMSYEKKWRCPYCFMYWPVGKPCDNRDCPSRYK